MTRHARVESDPLIAASVPLLATAASVIGDVQVRNRGTIGGSSRTPTRPRTTCRSCSRSVRRSRPRRAPARRTVPAREFFLGVMADGACARRAAGRDRAAEARPRAQGRRICAWPGSRAASRSRMRRRWSTAGPGGSPSAAPRVAVRGRRRRPGGARRRRAGRHATRPRMRSPTSRRRPTTGGQWHGVYARRAGRRRRWRRGREAEMRMPITVTVNGSPQQLEIDTRQNLVGLLREQLGLTGTHVGLLYRQLRRLHRRAGRRDGQVVLRAGSGRRRPGGHDDRVAQLRRRRPAPDPAGLRRQPGPAVRVLHAGHGALGLQAPRGESGSD